MSSRGLPNPETSNEDCELEIGLSTKDFDSQCQQCSFIFRRIWAVKENAHIPSARSQTSQDGQDTFYNSTDQPVLVHEMPARTNRVAAAGILSHCKRIIRNHGEVDIFKPHHSVTLRYPAISLLKRGEAFRIPIPMDGADRYDPSEPLVSDFSVTEHAGRRTERETAFVAYTKTILAAPYTDGYLDIDRMERDLHRDMEHVQQHAGETTLKMVIYLPEGETEDEMINWQCRFERVTKFYLNTQGGEMIDSNGYECSLDQVRQSAGLCRNGGWFRQMTDLFLRASNEAALYVRLSVEYHVKENGEPENLEALDEWIAAEKTHWKRSRTIDYGYLLDGIVKIVKAADLAEDQSTCLICTEDFWTKGHVPVKLPCDGSHLICRSCLTSVVESEGVEKAHCPLDRQQVFSQAQIDQLKFNVINSTFYEDQRFSDWENFQRSCSDLDTNLARSTYAETLIVDEPGMMFEIWLYLCDKDARNQEETTVPEFRQVMLAMDFGLRRLEHLQLTFKELYDSLQGQVYDRLAKRMARGRWRHILREEQLANLNKDNMPLRRGYREFIDRSINRTIWFMKLRKCECEDSLAKRMHTHGGRRYYNVKAYREDPDYRQGSFPKMEGGIESWLRTMEDEYVRKLRAVDPPQPSGSTRYISPQPELSTSWISRLAGGRRPSTSDGGRRPSTSNSGRRTSAEGRSSVERQNPPSPIRPGSGNRPRQVRFALSSLTDGERRERVFSGRVDRSARTQRPGQGGQSGQ